MTVISPPSSPSRVPRTAKHASLVPTSTRGDAHQAMTQLFASGQHSVKVDAPYVLGLYSSGGGGHVSALDSIETCLQPCIDVRRMAPLREVLHTIDPVAQLTGGRLDGELLFNKLAERGNTGLLSVLEKLGTRRVRTKRRAMAKLLRAAFDVHPPTLIVSTMPFINGAVSDVAHDMGIPFVLVPTDYDVRNFTTGLPTPLPPMQYVTHAFSGQSVAQASAQLGYPLRPQFAQPITASTYHALRQRQKIPVDRQVIVITMGSAGGVRALEFAQRLAA